MEYGFPPGSSLDDFHSMWLMSHKIMLSLVACAIAGHVWLRIRPTKLPMLWLWTSLIAGTPTVAYITWCLLPPDFLFRLPFKSSLTLYVLLVWIFSLTGNNLTNRALRRTRQRSRSTIIHGTCNWLFPVLVVIATGVVAIMPPVATGGPEARRRRCKNNLKQIGLALHDLHDSTGSFPTATSGDIPISWRVHMLRHLHLEQLFRNYDQTQTWDSAHNEPLAQHEASQYKCPSRHEPLTDAEGRHFTDYTMLTGLGSFSDRIQQTTRQDITDGASNTLAVVEATGLNIVWTEPRDASIDEQPIGINLKG